MSNIKLFKQYTLNKSTPIPLYFQFKNILLDMMKTGKLQPGDIIPTEFELCDIFGISRTTIRQALTELVNENKFYRVKGRGTFVSQNKIHQDFIRRIESFNAEMYRKGYTPSSEVLALDIIPSNAEISTALELPLNTDVIKLKRLRYADGEQVVITKTYLPYKTHKCNIQKYQRNGLAAGNQPQWETREVSSADMSTATQVETLSASYDQFARAANCYDLAVACY